jgi:hypothetical protein
VDPQGILTIVAGNGSSGSSGDGGPATDAEIGNPDGVAVDAAGNLYITDVLHERIRKVDTQGIITTVAGNGSLGSGGDGGPATDAELNGPQEVAVDAAGNLYIADSYNNRVRKVDIQGIITTVAGTGASGFSGDGGPAVSAVLNRPVAVSADKAGNFYITDWGNFRVRKVDTRGIITTVAGTGVNGFSGDGGPAISADLGIMGSLALDAAGNLYIGDWSNFRIRRVDVNGSITTVAGIGPAGGPNGCRYSVGGDGGPATSSSMCPNDVGTDSAGNLYILDYTEHRVRKVDVSQSAVSFGSHFVGTVTPSQVTVTNTGNQHIEFTGLSLTGDFGRLTGSARNCSDTTFLGAGFSCAIWITFAPTSAGTFTGSATVTDNSLSLPGTTQTISLSGTGVTP